MFTSVMATEFFTLCLIRKREEEREGKKLRDVVRVKRCLFVHVCVLHQLAAQQINKLLKTTLFIIFHLVFIWGCWSRTAAMRVAGMYN